MNLGASVKSSGVALTPPKDGVSQMALACRASLRCRTVLPTLWLITKRFRTLELMIRFVSIVRFHTLNRLKPMSVRSYDREQQHRMAEAYAPHRARWHDEFPI